MIRPGVCARTEMAQRAKAATSGSKRHMMVSPGRVRHAWRKGQSADHCTLWSVAAGAFPGARRLTTFSVSFGLCGGEEHRRGTKDAEGLFIGFRRSGEST